MGIVRFESQEYHFGGKVFAKLVKKTVSGKVRHDERSCQLTYRRNNRLCAQELIILMTEISGLCWATLEGLSPLLQVTLLGACFLIFI